MWKKRLGRIREMRDLRLIRFLVILLGLSLSAAAISVSVGCRSASAITVEGDVTWSGEPMCIDDSVHINGILIIENITITTNRYSPDISISASKGIYIYNSTIAMRGLDATDFPGVTIGAVTGHRHAGWPSSLSIMTAPPYPIVIENSQISAEGGDGADAMSGSTSGSGGGYTVGGSVSDFVGSGGNATLKLEAENIIINNSCVSTIAGNGGNAGNGGDGRMDWPTNGAGGGGYSSGMGGSDNGDSGGSGGNVLGHVGVGGRSSLSIVSKSVQIYASDLLAIAGSGGKAGDGGDGGNNGFGGPGGGGGGYSAGGGGGFDMGGMGGIGEQSGDGGGCGSVLDWVGSGGNSTLTVDADSLKVRLGCSLEAAAGSGGIVGTNGINRWRAGYGGLGYYMGRGGPANSYYATGSWGSVGTLGANVASGGSAYLALNSSHASIYRDSFIASHRGGGRVQGTSYLHVPVSVPEPISPASGSLAIPTPTLFWTPIFGSTAHGDVSSYFMQVSPDSQFQNIPFQLSVNDPYLGSYALTEPLADEEEYNWRIKANYTDGFSGDWSDAMVFVIDGQPPGMELISPANRSVIKAGTPVLLNITDRNMGAVTGALYGEVASEILPPYSVDTANWSDRMQLLTVRATDRAGNTAEAVFEFTVDSVPPKITLSSPKNGTAFIPGLPVTLGISETHPKHCRYSLDGGPETELGNALYSIDTSDWADGEHSLRVTAEDLAGNIGEKVYMFSTDGTPPEIVAVSPQNESIFVEWNSSVTIEFTEPADRDSVTGALAVTPELEILGYHWNNESTVLTVRFALNMTPGQTYIVTLSGSATDVIGNSLGNRSWSFTAWPDSDGDGIPDPPEPETADAYGKWIWPIIAILAICMLLAILYSVRRGKDRES